jgi:hypothetical protein
VEPEQPLEPQGTAAVRQLVVDEGREGGDAVDAGMRGRERGVAGVAGTEHAHAPVRLRQGSHPLDGGGPVLGLAGEGLERAVGVAAAADATTMYPCAANSLKRSAGDLGTTGVCGNSASRLLSYGVRVSSTGYEPGSAGR